MRDCAVLAFLFAGLAGCTWVDVDDEAAAVRLVGMDRVSQCERLGTTTATTKDKVGVIERNEMKVAGELLALARNSAAKMDGDTIVEQGPLERASQTFVVYACGEDP